MKGRTITYRDLRNTPGRVSESLAAGEYLSLVSEGVPKAVLIPVEDGDVATAIEAWRRGRGMIALQRLQQAARESEGSTLRPADIATEVSAARRARRRRESR